MLINRYTINNSLTVGAKYKIFPRILKTVKVSPFDLGVGIDRKMLIEVGDKSYIVSPALGVLTIALCKSGEIECIREELGQVLGRRPCDDEINHAISQLPRALFAAENESPVSSDWLFLIRQPLIDEGQTARLVSGLKWLFDKRIVSFVICASILLFTFVFAYYRHKYDITQNSALVSAFVVSVLTLSAFAHELGHAAACARFGVQPGHIGFGLYAFFPVLYVDVSRAWRLSAKQRAAVDLSGIYMQCILVILMSPLLLSAIARPPTAIIITYNLFWIFYNLNPVFKTDGYWLIADLVGVPNLRQKTVNFFISAFNSNYGYEAMSNSRSKIIYFIYGALVFFYLIGFALSIPIFLSRDFLPSLNITIDSWREAVELFRSNNVNGAFAKVFEVSLQTAIVVFSALLMLLLVIRVCSTAIQYIDKKKRA